MLITMLTKGLKRCYTIHETDIGEFQVCKVLNTYRSKSEAIEELVDLLTHRVTEEDILEKFTSEKDL